MHGPWAVRGITLVEAVTTSAIVAVLIGTAAPSFVAMLGRRSLEGVASQLATDLQYVRSEAVARNLALRMRFERADGASCYVIHTGAAGDCTCTGRAVASCSGGAVEIKTVQLPADGRVQLWSNASSMLFHPVRGTATPAGTLRVVGDGGAEIRHVVNILGRARSCSAPRAMAGYPAC